MAKQTAWYGISSIAARFINNLLTPLLTYNLANQADFGKVSLIYAAIPILNIFFTYGFETAYFRFSSREGEHKDIFSTASISLIVTTVLFTSLLWYFQTVFAATIGLQDFPVIIQLAIFIIALDALSVIPFAKLRQEGRPRMYAFVNIAGIFVNVFITWFYIMYCPSHVDAGDNNFLTIIYDPSVNPVEYVLVANVIKSAFVLLLLSKEIRQIRFNFNVHLWKDMMLYSLPLIIVGMGGMINETFDRLMLRWWLPGTDQFRESQVGIYSACYKLSILITLFIQAFRMGAEPFFFKQAQNENAQRIYARVMKFFVITVCITFLLITLYIPIWKYFIGERYRDGLSVVPILVVANICLGVYYNLSVWYKLSNRTGAGATITIIGTAITCLINFIFIPYFSYTASAWATLACYSSMMVISFIWGQKAYYVPYAWKKMLAYIVIVIVLFFIHKGITSVWNNDIFSLTIGSILTLAFIYFILKVEKKEFLTMPVVGRYIEKYV